MPELSIKILSVYTHSVKASLQVSVRKTSSMSLSVRSAGGHSHEGRKETVAGVNPKKKSYYPFYPGSQGEPISTPVTLKGQNQKASSM